MVVPTTWYNSSYFENGSTNFHEEIEACAIGPVILLNAHGFDVKPLSTQLIQKINTKLLH